MLKHSGLTEQIIGIFYDVYNELGYGYLESVYETCMCIALAEAGFEVRRQCSIPVWFRKQQVGEYYADIVVNDLIILELKSARAIDRAHEAQLLHYLKSTQFEVGLILNFGERPQFKRMVFDNPRKEIRENPCRSVAHFEGSSQ